MTWHHVLIICAALSMCVLCGMRDSCHDMLPQLTNLATAAIAGAMGHAQGQKHAHKKAKPATKPKDPSAGHAG